MNKIYFILFLLIIITGNLALSKEICGDNNIYDLDNVIGTELTCFGKPYVPISGAQKEDFDRRINQAIQTTEYGILSYKITQAIMMGKSFIEVGGTAVGAGPLMISVPGVFEIKLRSVRGKISWVIEGELVRLQMPYAAKYFPNMGFYVPTSGQSSI